MFKDIIPVRIGDILFLVSVICSSWQIVHWCLATSTIESLVESSSNSNIFCALELNTVTIFKHKLGITLADVLQFYFKGLDIEDTR